MGRREYRRYAKECLAMANATEDSKVRATLLQMAQTWFRLADEGPADADEDDADEPPG